MTTQQPNNPTTADSPKSAIEWIKNGEQVLAIIISGNHLPAKTEFVTPQTYKQQTGFIVYPAGGAIQPHIHREMERNLRGTSEVLIVRKGQCVVDFYRDDKSFLCQRPLHVGDVLILVSGGHGFRMVEDTVLLEVKQGPYVGEQEKERFDRADSDCNDMSSLAVNTSYLPTSQP